MKILSFVFILFVLVNLSNTQVIINQDVLLGDNICPFNCYEDNNQGLCLEGVCQCNQPYLPPYCAFTNTPIISNQINNGSISGSGYSYFQFELGILNEISLSLNVTSAGYNGTMALLLSNGNNMPDITSYDFMNQSDTIYEVSISLQISNQASYQNNWEVGVYCNESCDFSLLFVSSYSCPNDCSGNGLCSQQTQSCQCNDNFIMPDCSVQLTKIATKSNIPFITSTGWNFFYFNVTSAGDQLNITVYGLSGNVVQVYVRQYEMPTIFNYNNYFETDQSNQVIITKPTSSLWYIGIYSNGPANYSLYTDYQLLCPNQCNGNGDCGSNGVCQCNSPYQDLDCSLYNETLSDGVSLVGQLIAPGSINYYFFPVTVPNTAIVFSMMLQNSSGQGPKLFLSYNKIPNPYNFDYISYYDGDSENIVVMRDNSETGIWNCAVYIPSSLNTSSSFTYKILASTSLVCPNNCSGNGLCLETGKCMCYENYQYEDCSFYNVVYNNTPINNTMSSESEWHYYTVNVDDINQLTVSLRVDNPNVTLYLRFNNLPNLLMFNRKSQVSSDLHLWTITNEVIYSGTWYIGIFKPKGEIVNYYFTLLSQSVCVNNCTSPQHGSCINGSCQCKPGWVLNDCSSPNYEIISGQNRSGSVSAEEWDFYHIRVQGESALIITLEEIDTRYAGSIWVYVSEAVFPSTKNYMYNNISVSKIHTILIKSDIAGSGKVWVIGVFGSPQMGFNYNSVKYTINANTGCDGYKHCNSCVEDPNCGWCHTNALNSTQGSCYGGGVSGPSSEECPGVWSFSTCNTSPMTDENLLVGLYAGIFAGVMLFTILLIAALLVYRHNKNKKKEIYKLLNNNIN